MGALAGSALAERIPMGIAHVNDETAEDEANAPSSGGGASETGFWRGGADATVEAFTETRWTTLRRDRVSTRFEDANGHGLHFRSTEFHAPPAGLREHTDEARTSCQQL